jgi:hypothetical protein
MRIHNTDQTISWQIVKDSCPLMMFSCKNVILRKIVAKLGPSFIEGLPVLQLFVSVFRCKTCQASEQLQEFMVPEGRTIPKNQIVK